MSARTEGPASLQKNTMQDTPIIISSCLTKQQRVKLLFEGCITSEQKYQKIIELGRQLTPYPVEFKTAEHLVKGCQSTMHLHSELIDGKIRFHVFSEALISAGLAALLLAVYNDESPDVILTCPPQFLEELGIHGSLSPGRSNGLASLFQHMKKEALFFLINDSTLKNKT
jgi:cysteine desulfuration protein SufE